MSREIKADYLQLLMFPPSLEHWVGPEHPAHEQMFHHLRATFTTISKTPFEVLVRFWKAHRQLLEGG